MSRTQPTQLDTHVEPFRLTEPDGSSTVELAQLLESGPAVFAVLDEGAIDDGRASMLRELGERLSAGEATLVLVTRGASPATRRLAAVRAVRWLCDRGDECARSLGTLEAKRMRKARRREGLFVVDRDGTLRLAFLVSEPGQWIPASFVASRISRLGSATAPPPEPQPVHIPDAGLESEPDEPTSSEETMDVLVRSLGRALGLSGTSLTQLSTASRFRDLGMRAVPDEIITKTEPLTDEEWEIVRSHPERSAEMLGPSPLFADVRAIVRATHEHVDGSGYPDGVSGEDIPLAARIILVAESHLALEAMGDPDPLATLRERAGTVYDARVVDALAAVLGESSTPHAAHG